VWDGSTSHEPLIGTFCAEDDTVKNKRQKVWTTGNHMFIEHNNYGQAEFIFEAYMSSRKGQSSSRRSFLFYL